MQISTKNEKINEIKRTPDKTILPEENSEILSEANVPFANLLSEQINGIYNQDSEYSILNADFDYNSLSMDFSDAMFFINLVKEGQFTVNINPDGNFQSVIQTEIIQNTISQKTVEVTNQLTELIEKAQSTQKPVRISFDNDVSVILKIDKHGKVSAEFIPGSVEVENYLRNNIASLKQKFDEQNLPYNELLYRQNSKQNRNKNNERGEK